MGCSNSKNTTQSPRMTGPVPISDDNLEQCDESIRKNLLSYDKDCLSRRNMMVFGPPSSGKTLLPIALKLLKTDSDNAESFLQKEEEKEEYTKAFIQETWNCICLLSAIQERSKELKLPAQYKKLKHLSPASPPSGKDELKAVNAAVTSLSNDKQLSEFLKKKASEIPLNSCKLDSFSFYLQNFSKVVMESRWEEIQPSELLHFVPETQPRLDYVSIDNLGVNMIQAEGIYSETNYMDWKEQITSVDAIVFVVPLSHYDHQEDPGFERLFHFYSLLASGRTVASIPWVVIFSKLDIFSEKLEANPESFGETFPDFEKKSDKLVDSAIEFLKQKLLNLNHLNAKKVLFFPLNLHNLDHIKKFSSDVSDFLPAYSIKREKQRRKKKEEKILSQSNLKEEKEKEKDSEDEN